METKRKKVKLQNKVTEEIKIIEIIQRDSVQGFWCIEEDTAVWEWYPHDQWKEIK